MVSWWLYDLSEIFFEIISFDYLRCVWISHAHYSAGMTIYRHSAMDIWAASMPGNLLFQHLSLDSCGCLSNVWYRNNIVPGSAFSCVLLMAHRFRFRWISQQLWSFQGVIDAGGAAMLRSWHFLTVCCHKFTALVSQLAIQSCGKTWEDLGRPGKLTVCCQCCISMVRYCEAFLLRVAPDSDWHFLAKAAANNVTKNIKKKQHIFSVSAKDGGHIHKHL